MHFGSDANAAEAREVNDISVADGGCGFSVQLLDPDMVAEIVSTDIDAMERMLLIVSSVASHDDEVFPVFGPRGRAGLRR